MPDSRAFALERVPGFAECAPSGRVRLDAIAGWLQDVAYADVEDAGLAEAAVWVVRRTRIRVRSFPRFGQRYRLTTFCSGLGRMWAERRTDLVPVSAASSEPPARDGHGSAAAESEASVEAVSLWVHLAPGSLRPVPLTPAELETYGGQITERRVSARLRHGPPTPAAASRSWTFRRAERDIADHVNNAAYWTPIEEELLAGAEPDTIDLELEYRTPAQPGEMTVRRDGPRGWLLGPDGELHASWVTA